MDYLDKKEHGLLYKNQKEVCTICNKNLQIYMNGDENLVLEDISSKYGMTHPVDWFSKIVDNEWDYFDNTYKVLNIDHKIPLALSFKNPVLYNILDDLENKQLVHTSCHILKNNQDKINIKRIKKMSKCNDSINLVNIKTVLCNEEVKVMYGMHKSYKKLIKILSELV